MATITENDMLITSGKGKILLDLECGYGQPCTTTVYKRTHGGEIIEILTFDKNASNKEIGPLSTLKNHIIEIHTTIQDAQDNAREMVDISLKVVVKQSGTNNAENLEFTRKTKGKGSLFNSFYNVTIL